jgi:hypothetical protein
MHLRERLRARERRLGPCPVLEADAGLEVVRVDAELRGQPLERVGSRARLPALDLADVLLRAPARSEAALGQAGGDPEGADALSDSRFPVYVPGRRSEVRVLEIT